MNLVCVSGNAAATSVITTNLGETAATVAGAGLLSLGNFISTAGLPGVNQSDVTPLSTNIVSVGGGGSNAGPTAGSAATVYVIRATDFSPLLIPNNVTSSIASDGVSFTSWKPFFTTGGSAGGCYYVNAGNGGKGGDGGFGSGGGAGGAAYNGTGGVGGKGGDGLVIIATF
jgi:hypothetical protein